MLTRIRSALERPYVSAMWLGLGYIGLVGLYLLSGLHMEGWDDSYFFKRIGINLLEHGSVAWNLEDGPVYGNTSQGFQVLSLLPLAISPTYYISLVKLMSALAMVLLWLIYMHMARTLPAPERPLAYLVAFLAAAAPYGLLLVHSGMETCTALAVLGANLLAIRHRYASPPQAQDTAAPSDAPVGTTVPVVLSTVAVYLIRPDAALISMVTLTVYPWLATGKPPWRLWLYTGLGLALVLGAMYLYFGTPFPLSFYLKSHALTTYSEYFVNLKGNLIIKRRNLIGVLLMAAPLIFIALHNLMSDRMRPWRRPFTSALLVAATAFFAYHYVSTLEIMSYYGRFYVPGLVPIALAAVHGAPSIRTHGRWWLSAAFLILYAGVILYLYQHRMIYDEKEQIISRIHDQVYMGYVAAAALVLLSATTAALWRRPWTHTPLVIATVAAAGIGALQGLPAVQTELRDDEALLSTNINRYTTVRGIRAVRACIPQPFHMYHTEIGIPGIVFQESTVTDMAGLMDKDIARRGMDFDARCLADRPEVLYLPHRNYKALRDQIMRSTCIRDYRVAVKNSSSPLYIRRDLADEFFGCAQRVRDPWVKNQR